MQTLLIVSIVSKFVLAVIVALTLYMASSANNPYQKSNEVKESIQRLARAVKTGDIFIFTDSNTVINWTVMKDRLVRFKFKDSEVIYQLDGPLDGKITTVKENTRITTTVQVYIFNHPDENTYGVMVVTPLGKVTKEVTAYFYDRGVGYKYSLDSESKSYCLERVVE